MLSLDKGSFIASCNPCPATYGFSILFVLSSVMERGTGTEISLLNIKHEHDFSVFFNLNKKFPKWVFESAIYLAFISWRIQT